jgi:hypothetical protein
LGAILNLPSKPGRKLLAFCRNFDRASGLRATPGRPGIDLDALDILNLKLYAE